MNATNTNGIDDEGPRAIEEGDCLGADTVGRFFAGEWRWFKWVWLAGVLMALIILADWLAA